MVSCLMGDSTALASAIVRCCLRIGGDGHDLSGTGNIAQLQWPQLGGEGLPQGGGEAESCPLGGGVRTIPAG